MRRDHAGVERGVMASLRERAVAARWKSFDRMT
jgi:hypothetical protein